MKKLIVLLALVGVASSGFAENAYKGCDTYAKSQPNNTTLVDLGLKTSTEGVLVGKAVCKLVTRIRDRVQPFSFHELPGHYTLIADDAWEYAWSKSDKTYWCQEDNVKSCKPIEKVPA